MKDFLASLFLATGLTFSPQPSYKLSEDVRVFTITNPQDNTQAHFVCTYIIPNQENSQ